MARCLECGSTVFSNGGHLVSCSRAFTGLPNYYPADDSSPESRGFVNAWDEVTYYTDDREGDR